MKPATAIEVRLADWHRRKYGDRPVNGDATVRKLLEEVGELIQAMLANDHANARLECADIGIVLVHLVRGLGGSLHAEMESKCQVLEERLAAQRKEAKG